MYSFSVSVYCVALGASMRTDHFKETVPMFDPTLYVVMCYYVKMYRSCACFTF
jgi:hypothetical protein